MKNSLTALDRETQLLVAAGSAVAAGCIPCLQTIVDMARAEGVEERKLREAVMTGQYVKEQPITMMKQFADDLVGTHLQSKPVSMDGGCPLSRQVDRAAEPAQNATKEANLEAVPCKCSSARK
jgi:AhpD family alkylhydroperoxidase